MKKLFVALVTHMTKAFVHRAQVSPAWSQMKRPKCYCGCFCSACMPNKPLREFRPELEPAAGACAWPGIEPWPQASWVVAQSTEPHWPSKLELLNDFHTDLTWTYWVSFWVLHSWTISYCYPNLKGKVALLSLLSNQPPSIIRRQIGNVLGYQIPYLGNSWSYKCLRQYRSW